MSIFVLTPHSLKSHNGLPWKHEISYNQSALIFEDNIPWHLSRSIAQIYTYNAMSYVFNVGLITFLDASLPNVFLHF